MTQQFTGPSENLTGGCAIMTGPRASSSFSVPQFVTNVAQGATELVKEANGWAERLEADVCGNEESAPWFCDGGEFAGKAAMKSTAEFALTVVTAPLMLTGCAPTPPPPKPAKPFDCETKAERLQQHLHDLDATEKTM